MTNETTRTKRKTCAVGDKVFAVQELTSSGTDDTTSRTVFTVIPAAHTGVVDQVTRTDVWVSWDGPVQVRTTHGLDEGGRSAAFAEQSNPADALAPEQRSEYPPAPSESRANKHWVRAIHLPIGTNAGSVVEGYLARLEPDEGRMFHWAFIEAPTAQQAEELTAREPERLMTVDHPNSILIAPFPDYVLNPWSKYIARELTDAELVAVVEQEGVLMVTFHRDSRVNRGTPQSVAIAKAELKRRREKAGA